MENNNIFVTLGNIFKPGREPLKIEVSTDDNMPTEVLENLDEIKQQQAKSGE